MRKSWHTNTTQLLLALDRTVLPRQSLWRGRDVPCSFAKRTRPLAAARAQRNSRYRDLCTTFVRQFIRWLRVRRFSGRFRWNDSALNGFSLRSHWRIHSMTALRLACTETSILRRNNFAAIQALIDG